MGISIWTALFLIWFGGCVSNAFNVWNNAESGVDGKPLTWEDAPAMIVFIVFWPLLPLGLAFTGVK